MRLLQDPERMDLLFVLPLLLLCGIGLVMVYSATMSEYLHWSQTLWFRQILHFFAGLVLIGIILVLRPGIFYAIAYPAYILANIALIYVAVGGGVESHGAGRWIDLGGFHIQPSELAKLAYTLALARYLNNSEVRLERLTSFILPGLLFIIPFVLVLRQPDLSTALVFSCITLVAFYWNGLSLGRIFLLISPGLSVIATVEQWAWGALLLVVLLLAYKLRIGFRLTMLFLILNMAAGYTSFTIWNGLKDHQRSRILTFIDPMRDPKGAGYQVIQSKVAIGSGGLTGKGLGQGSQTNLNFLPEEHTDFIFSVLGEQFGFVGALAVILLYFLLLARALTVCHLHGHRFLNQVVVGGCSIFAFHIIVNIAMTLGMMPVTGLPLPFLSYGGSFMLTCMALVGLILNMRVRGHQL